MIYSFEVVLTDFSVYKGMKYYYIEILHVLEYFHPSFFYSVTFCHLN